LAKMLKDDLESELRSLGFTVASVNNCDRELKVNIIDWNFDTYINGKFWYDCSITVLDKVNNVLADSKITDTIIIKGSVWVGAKYAFEKELPIIYQKIIRGILRENPKVLSALKTGN